MRHTSTSGLPGRDSEAWAHAWPVRVYWEDTDAGGIVFYANYLKYLERGRTEWLRGLGYAQETLKAQYRAMFVVCNVHIDYLRPARLDDALQVRTRLVHCGGSALQLQQNVVKLREPGGLEQNVPAVLLTQAQVRIAWVDDSALRPARIPSALHERLQQGFTAAGDAALG